MSCRVPSHQPCCAGNQRSTRSTAPCSSLQAAAIRTLDCPLPAARCPLSAVHSRAVRVYCPLSLALQRRAEAAMGMGDRLITAQRHRDTPSNRLTRAAPADPVIIPARSPSIALQDSAGPLESNLLNFVRCLTETTNNHADSTRRHPVRVPEKLVTQPEARLHTLLPSTSRTTPPGRQTWTASFGRDSYNRRPKQLSTKRALSQSGPAQGAHPPSLWPPHRWPRTDVDLVAVPNVQSHERRYFALIGRETDHPHLQRRPGPVNPIDQKVGTEQRCHSQPEPRHFPTARLIHPLGHCLHCQHRH